MDTRRVFDWTEVPCASREAAWAEAKHRQELEHEDVEWIYLQAYTTKQWVARRTPRDPDAYQPAPFPEDDGPLWMQAGDKAFNAATGLIRGLLDPTNWT